MLLKLLLAFYSPFAISLSILPEEFGYYIMGCIYAYLKKIGVNKPC